MGSLHHLGSQGGEAFDFALRRERIGFRWPMGEHAQPRGQLVQTHGDGLAQVHRRLDRGGRNDQQTMAESQIGAREAVLFGSKYQRHPAAAREFLLYKGDQVWKQDDGVFRLAVSGRSRAEDESARGECFGKRWKLTGVAQQVRSPDGRPGFAPMSFERGYDGEMGEAEVSHGARGRAHVERVTGRNQNDFDWVELRGGRQDTIVLPRVPAGALHRESLRRRSSGWAERGRESRKIAAIFDLRSSEVFGCYKNFLPGINVENISGYLDK